MTDSFSRAILTNGGQIESIALDAGQAINIAWFGCPEPKRVLIHSSRGEAGSSIQLEWLERIGAIPADGAIAIVQGLHNADDAQAARRYQLYLSTRLLSAEYIVVIDQLITEEDNLYTRMLPLAKVEYAEAIAAAMEKAFA